MTRRAIILLSFAAFGTAAACGSFGSSNDDPPAPIDGGSDVATVEDGAAPLDDGGAIDAGGDAIPPYVKPSCYVADAGVPPIAQITIAPNPAKAGVKLDFDVASIQGYGDVEFKICAADGGIAPHVNGLIDSNGTPIHWQYNVPAGLPSQWIQAQFFSDRMTTHVLRGTADFYIAPQ